MAGFKTLYATVDGTDDVVLKIAETAKGLEVFVWDGTGWKDAPGVYEGIFVGEVDITYIKEGDADWNRLNLQK